MENDIASFKSQTVNLYGKDQRPGMGTNKFHLLDNFVEDVVRVGSLLFLSADSFESSHKSVKEPFTATSKRNATWMPERYAVMRRNKMYRSALSRMAGSDSMLQTVHSRYQNRYRNRVTNSTQAFSKSILK
jgi:hypothetical protein